MLKSDRSVFEDWHLSEDKSFIYQWCIYAKEKSAILKLFANNCRLPLQKVWNQIRPDKTSGLIWIQTVWHSGGIPERSFRKKWFWKKAADGKQQAKLPSMLRVNQRKQTSLDWLTEHNLTVLVLFYTYTTSFIVAADDTWKLSKIRRLTLCMLGI